MVFLFASFDFSRNFSIMIFFFLFVVVPLPVAPACTLLLSY